MIVAIGLAGVAVVVAVVLLASGLGGELSEAHPDHPPLPLPGNRPIAGTDAALLRLPVGIWGYHTRVTDEALRRLSYALTERDTRIAILEQQVAELRQKQGPPDEGDATGPATSGGWPGPAEDEDTTPATASSPAAASSSWTRPAETLEFESRAEHGRAAAEHGRAGAEWHGTEDGAG